MRLFLRKMIVKFRIWYANVRGHHSKRWDYEPSENYMTGHNYWGRHKKKRRTTSREREK